MCAVDVLMCELWTLSCVCCGNRPVCVCCGHCPLCVEGAGHCPMFLCCGCTPVDTLCHGHFVVSAVDILTYLCLDFENLELLKAVLCSSHPFVGILNGAHISDADGFSVSGCKDFCE